jgi:hypothetical protein
MMNTIDLHQKKIGEIFREMGLGVLEIAKIWRPDITLKRSDF